MSHSSPASPTLNDTDKYKARSILLAGGIDNPTEDQIAGVARTLAGEQEREESRIAEALNNLAEKLNGGQEVQATLAKILEATQTRQEEKERKDGKTNGPRLTAEGTADEDDRVRALNASALPHFLLERFEKRQFVPLFYLRPSLMLRTYEDQTNNHQTQYLASLYAFLEAYKTLNAAKHSASSDDAVTSISVFVSSIVSRFAQAKDDRERLDILLYDRSQRINLAKASASTFNFNIGRWSDSAFVAAQRSRHEMFTSVNAPLPNVYHHLPLSSPYHPHFSSTTSYSSSSPYTSSSSSSHIYPSTSFSFPSSPSSSSSYPSRPSSSSYSSHNHSQVSSPRFAPYGNNNRGGSRTGGGFRLGIDPNKATLNESKTLPPEQLKLAKVLSVRQLNGEYIQKEKSAGRISAEMSKQEVEDITGSFQVSPFGIVERPGKEPRHVRNFSFPYTSNRFNYLSVNDRISAFSPYPSAYWCGPRHFAQLVLEVDSNSEGQVDDLSKAFRRIPIHPVDRCWTDIEEDGKFHIDYCLPMGYSPATDIFGRLMDFTRLAAGVILAEQLAAHGGKFVAFRSWVDDIVVFIQRGRLSSFQATQLLDEFYDSLGFPLAPDKCQVWSSVVRFLGLDWDLKQKIVSLPEEKRVKAIVKITEFLTADWCTEQNIEGLAGYLSHISFAIPHSRSPNPLSSPQTLF
ncbi:hypothetical protein JCM21900_000655 [Sporobolomyces salmonicolor]